MFTPPLSPTIKTCLHHQSNSPSLLRANEIDLESIEQDSIDLGIWDFPHYLIFFYFLIDIFYFLEIFYLSDKFITQNLEKVGFWVKLVL